MLCSLGEKLSEWLGPGWEGKESHPAGGWSILGVPRLSIGASPVLYLEGIKGILSQIANDTRLGKNVDLLEGRKICSGIWTGWIDGLGPRV